MDLKLKLWLINKTKKNRNPPLFVRLRTKNKAYSQRRNWRYSKLNTFRYKRLLS